MFDPKSLLNDLLGSTIPEPASTVRDTAGKATQMAKDNPLAAGALVAVLLGTGTGRQVTGAALKLGGIAAIGGLAYKAYQNYKNGDSRPRRRPGPACCRRPRTPASIPRRSVDRAVGSGAILGPTLRSGAPGAGPIP